MRQRYGLTQFHLNDNDELDPAYPPVALNIRVLPYKREATRYVAFWLKPVSIFGLYTRDDVYQQFTYVGHIVKPSPVSALMLADIASSHELAYPIGAGTLSR